MWAGSPAATAVRHLKSARNERPPLQTGKRGELGGGGVGGGGGPHCDHGWDKGERDKATMWGSEERPSDTPAENVPSHLLLFSFP